MRRLALLLALAGCAAAEGPVRRDAAPISVVLYPDTVTVRLADGSLCTGPRGPAAGGWQGRLAGCARTWPFTVARPATRPRQPLAPADGAAPWVVLEGPAGSLGYAPAAAPGA